MKINLSKYYLAFLFPILLGSCDKAENEHNIINSAQAIPDAPLAIPASSEMINFDNSAFTAGKIITEVKSTAGTLVNVYGINSERKGKNAAMIFNSHQPGAMDIDLGTPNETFKGPGKGDGGRKGQRYANSSALKNVLIITDDFKTSAANDHDKGGSLSLTFSNSGPVTVHSLTVIDLEEKENDSNVKLYNKKGDLIKTIKLPITGDNGVAVVDLQNTAQVSKLVVNLKGSGAIDNINFTKKQNQGGNPGGGDGGTPGNGGSDPTPDPPANDCSECKGKVKELTLKYTGFVANADITIMVKTTNNKGMLMKKVVQPNTSFVVKGKVDSNFGFDGTLGEEIKVFINGQLHVTINTSCTLPIGPGLVAGDFLVTQGYSTEGGLLCEVDPDQIGIK